MKLGKNKSDRLNQKTVKELYKELLITIQEKFNLKIQSISEQVRNVHLLKNTRRKIARIKTILIQKGYKI